LNTILTTLTTHGITTITAQPPTLEQLFMRHYGSSSDTQQVTAP
ncbi:hypothetical protein CLV72_1051, partial [Allonocardiopsis opalescens]